jgi:hypothetical protein
MFSKEVIVVPSASLKFGTNKSSALSQEIDELDASIHTTRLFNTSCKSPHVVDISSIIVFTEV